MPRVWRLTPPAYARILDGEGNRVTGARWNSPGRGVVYTCEHLSLAVLETYLHIPAALRTALPDFEAVCLAVPDDAGVAEVSAAEFRAAAASADPAAACRAIGDRWRAAGTDLVLAAPSVVVAEERNMILNPAHPRMADVTVVSSRRFHFDARLATPV